MKGKSKRKFTSLVIQNYSDYFIVFDNEQKSSIDMFENNIEGQEKLLGLVRFLMTEEKVKVDKQYKAKKSIKKNRERGTKRRNLRIVSSR